MYPINPQTAVSENHSRAISNLLARGKGTYYGSSSSQRHIFPRSNSCSSNHCRRIKYVLETTKSRVASSREAGKAFTLLALYLDVDFDLAEVAYTPSEVWIERYPESASDLERLLKESEIYSNLIKDVEMTLLSLK